VQELGQLDGVCSFWEAAQALVASLAERLGLLAHPPAAVEAAREKQVLLSSLCQQCTLGSTLASEPALQVSLPFVCSANFGRAGCEGKAGAFSSSARISRQSTGRFVSVGAHACAAGCNDKLVLWKAPRTASLLWTAVENTWRPQCHAQSMAYMLSC
jgi:hypothetical protein